MAILVTGAGGYIGSHCVRALQKAGQQVVAVDDLSHGHRQAIPESVPFASLNISDRDGLKAFLSRHSIEAVIHFAAFIEAGESVVNPRKYFENNLGASLAFFGLLLDLNIKRLIFSSTAAVYGNPPRVPIDESSPLVPINPYGVSKLMVENVLREYARAHDMGVIAFRYFNVAGAMPDGSLGEAHEPESHLIPRILQAGQGRGQRVFLNGTDYPTRDGTCVRDYVHVCDLVDAHILGLKALRQGQFETYNIGSESGYTVREVIRTCEAVLGSKLNVEECPRRPGDPAELVASSARLRRELGWRPRFPDLDSMISHAWAWHKSHPQGFH